MSTPATPTTQAPDEEIGAHESSGIVTPLKLVVSTVLVQQLQQWFSLPDNDMHIYIPMHIMANMHIWPPADSLLTAIQQARW